MKPDGADLNSTDAKALMAQYLGGKKLLLKFGTDYHL